LIRNELVSVDGRLQHRKEREGSILAEAKRRTSEWVKEKKTLDAEMHRTELQITVAEGDVRASENLAKLVGKKSRS